VVRYYFYFKVDPTINLICNGKMNHLSNIDLLPSLVTSAEESCGHDWPTRYKIIKGICEGLNYLHRESIVHLDLKPGNVLLDKRMNPKIADFGLSIMLSASTHITEQKIGTV
jgi:serine/threonine protein kinase